MKAIKVQLVKVSKANSKQVKSAGGAVINFVNRHWGLKRGYLDQMNFKNVHPLDSNFVEIKAELIRF